MTLSTLTVCAADLPQDQRTPCEVWTRVMGYHRPVRQFNAGKQAEHRERRLFLLPADIARGGGEGLPRRACENDPHRESWLMGHSVGSLACRSACGDIEGGNR